KRGPRARQGKNRIPAFAGMSGGEIEPRSAWRPRRCRDRRAGRRRDRGDTLRGGRHLARLARLPTLCHRRRLPCSRRRDGLRFARGVLPPIASLGIGQFGILIALLNYGLRTVPAGRGALIFASFPLITLVVAALLGHEHVTVRKITGILATMSGVALALGDKI